MGRIEKTLHMFWQAKNCRAAVLALITANALEDPQAIMEAMGEDVDVGVIPIYKFPVKPDFFRLLHHGFRSLLEILALSTMH
jgi:hypothetical protein